MFLCQSLRNLHPMILLSDKQMNWSSSYNNILEDKRLRICNWYALCIGLYSFNQISLLKMITLGWAHKKKSVKMSHKKFKKDHLSLLHSAYFSSILDRFTRGCYKSIESHATKKRVAWIFTDLTKTMWHCQSGDYLI